MATIALNPKLTKAGLALMPNGTATGFSITLTHLAIGTALYTPDGTEVALKAEIARYPISSGTNPTTTSIQTGTTITDTDPNGRSPNGQNVGEIGWFSGTTLVAVWSRLNTPLFQKSANFDVPFAYTLDVSALPENSITVNVATDPQGMAALILQHEAKTDPHAMYVQKVRGVADYDAKANYGAGARVIGPDNKTYRSLTANNLGNTPATSPTKWERWAFSLAELDAEFIPRRLGVKTGGADATGMVRVVNPDTASYSTAAGTGTTGALRIQFPVAAVDSNFRMRLEVFDVNGSRAFSVLLSAQVSSGFVWSNVSAVVLADLADRDLAVRVGNDGTRPVIWIGELASTWAGLRAYISEVMVSQNADGGSIARWNTGWTLGPVTVFNTVQMVVSSNLVFGQTDIDHVAGLSAALLTKFDKSGGVVSGNTTFAASVMLQSGGYSMIMRADSSGLWGIINQAGTAWSMQVTDGGVVSFPRARPNWLGGATPWDTLNFNPANYLPLSGGNINGTLAILGSNVLLLQASNGYSQTVRSDAGGWAGFINQSGSAWTIRAFNDGTVVAGGNLQAGGGSAVYQTDGNVYGGAWGGYLSSYLTGNINNLQNNINQQVPRRNGNQGYGFVWALQNSIQIGWDGANYPLYTDNQFQGYILHSGTFQNWAAPRSIMDYGGVGSYTYMNTGANPGVNTLVNLPGLGGTWRVMSGAFGANGKDILYVRIG